MKLHLLCLPPHTMYSGELARFQVKIMNDIVCWKLKFFWNYWTDEIKMPEAPLRKAMQVCKLKQIHLCAHWKG